MTIDMKPQLQSSAREVLAGLVERVTYHNAENGFCVLRAKARGHRDIVTVVGHAATIAAGEWITASGEWINDPHPRPAVQGTLVAHAMVLSDENTRLRRPAGCTRANPVSTRGAPAIRYIFPSRERE